MGPPSMPASKLPSMSRSQRGLGSIGGTSGKPLSTIEGEQLADYVALNKDGFPEEQNPFSVPPDEDIFKLQEEQKQQRALTRAQLASLSVQDRTTFASRMQSTLNGDQARQLAQQLHADMRIGLRGKEQDGALQVPSPFQQEQAVDQSKLSTAEQAMSNSGSRWRERDNMIEFIAKKREIFLVQMSLDTKRAEINKLVDREQLREQALKESEEMLEADAARFDKFLKENDELLQKAVRQADEETRAKNDKLAEIKRLNTVIAALKSEMGRVDEVRDECRKYQRFLDGITPQEWFDQHAARIRAKKEARLEQWRQQCEQVRQRKAAAHEAKLRAEQVAASAKSKQAVERAERRVYEAAAALRRALEEPEPPQPDVEDPAVVPVEEPPMYYTDPQQLLKVFSQLESDNLFLIQNSQEAEQELEGLRSKMQDTRSSMEAKVEHLRSSISKMELQVGVAAARVQRMREVRQVREQPGRELDCDFSSTSSSRSSSKAGATAGLQTLQSTRRSSSAAAKAAADAPAVTLEDKLAQVAAKVKASYMLCGFDVDDSMSSLSMLANLETKVEEYLAAVDKVPREFREAAERAREKERRQVIREEKHQAQAAEHEARVQRALQRAAAPVFKKSGKPAMWRSQIVHKEVGLSDEQQQQQNEEEELEAFLGKDMLL